MFGYVKPDTPYLYIKDETLYKALYCGVCKSLGRTCGQCSRFTLTYDVAFLSAVLHNILGVDVTVEKKRCIAHPIIKRPIAKPDEISDTLACLNVILAYYKVQDDINDNGRGRFLKLLFSPAFKRAVKRYPDFKRIVFENYEKLAKLEKAGEQSIDKICDPFASMLESLASRILGDGASESSYKFFYNMGKWIYLIDALDDYDKDIKKGNYNPFYCAYKSSDFTTLKTQNGEEISFIVSATLAGIEEGLKGLKFRFNADLIRNIALRGTMQKTKQILAKTSVKKGVK